MPNRFALLLAVASTLALSACGNGSSLTTGSLFSSSSEAKAAPTDPRVDRALEAGATSARAAKCGYNFDQAKLRNSYLSYEKAQGGSPEELAKAEKTFDYTRTSILAKIAQEEGFCSEGKTKEIKANLTRYLAGDFSATPRKAMADVPSGWFNSSTRAEPMDREKIFDPMARRATPQ